MKKNTKAFTALLLTIIMAVTTVSISAAAYAKAQTYKTYKTYIVFGDSIAAGSGLKGYKTTSNAKCCWPRVKNSYADIVATKSKTTKFYNFAKPGMRTSEIRLLLDDTYQGDYFSTAFLPKDPATIAEMRFKTIRTVKKANLITVEIGSNDQFVPLIRAGMIMQRRINYYEELKREQNMTFDQFMQEGLQALQFLSEDAPMIANLAPVMATAQQHYYENMNYIIKTLHELNPKAKLVMIGDYNPFRDWTIPPGFGSLSQAIPLEHNKFLKQDCQYRRWYTYVDVSEAEAYCQKTPGLTTFSENEIDPVTGEQKTVNLHPTPESHKYMATQILKAIQ